MNEFKTNDPILIRKYKNIKKNTINETNIDIIFTGDSLMESFNNKEYIKNLVTHNTAIGGITTKDLLNNIDIHLNNYNYNKAFVLIGTNDIQKDISFDETLNNIKDIISKVKKDKVLYIISLLPINETFVKSIGKRSNKYISKINNFLKTINHDNIEVININKNLLNNEQLKENYTYDGLHLTKEGYSAFYKDLIKYI